MIISIEGQEKTGKTTIAYTAPLPIVGFSFDMGTERALYGTQYDKYFKDLEIQIISYKRGARPEVEWKDITVFELPQPMQLDTTKIVGYTDLWEYFIRYLSLAVQSSVRTIVIDTMTLARRIKADAYLEELQQKNTQYPRKQLLQIEWGHANDAVRDIYTTVAGMRKNSVALHHLTDERRDAIDRDGLQVSLLTGNKIMEGYTKTYQHVDLAIRTDVKDGQVKAKIMTCGHNLSLTGQELSNPNWNSLTGAIEMSLQDRVKFEKR